jgi:hypothetical protein
LKKFSLLKFALYLHTPKIRICELILLNFSPRESL